MVKSAQQEKMQPLVMNRALNTSSAADRAAPEQRTTELVQLYYPYIVRLIQSIVHDGAEAEDLAQETFIAALQALDRETARVNYKAWLSQIAVNKARDLLRRRKVRQRWAGLLGRSSEARGAGRLPEDIAALNETAQQLWQAVEKLNEKHRLPIILRYGHDLSIREIAHVLEIKEGTVHSRLHNAQKQLARELDLDVASLLLWQGGGA